MWRCKTRVKCIYRFRSRPKRCTWIWTFIIRPILWKQLPIKYMNSIPMSRKLSSILWTEQSCHRMRFWKTRITSHSWCRLKEKMGLCRSMQWIWIQTSRFQIKIIWSRERKRILTTALVLVFQNALHSSWQILPPNSIRPCPKTNQWQMLRSYKVFNRQWATIVHSPIILPLWTSQNLRLLLIRDSENW